MRDDDEESAIDNNNIASTPPKPKPVCDEDRHVTYTGEQHVETESTKHNADKAVSCNSTATIETPRPDDVRPQVRENSNGEGFQVLIETESWRTAKNWKSDSCSSEIRSDRGKRGISHGLPSFISFACLQCSTYVFTSFPLLVRLLPRSWFKNLFMAFSRGSSRLMWVTTPDYVTREGRRSVF